MLEVLDPRDPTSNLTMMKSPSSNSLRRVSPLKLLQFFREVSHVSGSKKDQRFREVSN
jgi:hypothetical protein